MSSGIRGSPEVLICSLLFTVFHLFNFSVWVSLYMKYISKTVWTYRGFEETKEGKASRRF